MDRCRCWTRQRPLGVGKTLFYRLSESDREAITTAAERAGLADFLEVRAGTLSHGQKQWLEISMVILQDPKLFLVDEPAAAAIPLPRQYNHVQLLILPYAHMTAK